MKLSQGRSTAKGITRISRGFQHPSPPAILSSHSFFSTRACSSYVVESQYDVARLYGASFRMCKRPLLSSTPSRSNCDPRYVCTHCVDSYLTARVAAWAIMHRCSVEGKLGTRGVCGGTLSGCGCAEGTPWSAESPETSVARACTRSPLPRLCDTLLSRRCVNLGAMREMHYAKPSGSVL